MTKNLQVDFLGTILNNPFILASAPPTKDYESIKKAFEAGWAGAVTKSISLNSLKDKTPRISHIKHGGKIIASQNYEMGSIYSPEQWVIWTTKLRKEFPDKLIYVSLFADSNVNEWKQLSKIFLDAPIQGLELNFSCPHSDHNGRGSVIGQSPELCSEITRAVKEIVGSKLKIMPKLTYLSHPNEGLVAQICIDAGADAIAGINTIAGLCEINPYSLKPKFNTGEKTTAGGLSYELIRPFGRLIISQVAKSIDWQKYPISAMGGVSKNIDSIVEYFALGANHVQVCTEVMNNGVAVIKDLTKNLENYLETSNRTLDSIRGKALSYIDSWNNLDSIKRVAAIAESDCTKCYSCVPNCVYDAIKLEKGKVPVITENCDGCGSCYSNCPSNAISMIAKI
jgi:dihydropyrimidine dehydrogenase (NAD+) subunit PreA